MACRLYNLQTKLVCGGLGAQPTEKKLHFSYQGIKNFVDYSVLNMNIIPSITVEWNKDNIFMLFKIPLFEGGLLKEGIIKQKVHRDKAHYDHNQARMEWLQEINK